MYWALLLTVGCRNFCRPVLIQRIPTWVWTSHLRIHRTNDAETKQTTSSQPNKLRRRTSTSQTNYCLNEETSAVSKQLQRSATRQSRNATISSQRRPNQKQLTTLRSLTNISLGSQQRSRRRKRLSLIHISEQSQEVTSPNISGFFAVHSTLSCAPYRRSLAH